MSLQPEPDVHPVLRAKAPWILKAESYFMLLKLREHPEGMYDQLEKSWEGEEFGTFKGGLAAIVIVRYNDTPVGPYDELILVPGNFTVPQPGEGPPTIPKKSLRIARIYVSQRTTTYNGRLNWNIPKHLARFSFSAPPTPSGASPPETLTVRVYPPGTSEGDSTPPFFACTLKPWRWIPAIPMNTAYLPIKMLITQPPCPETAGQRTAVSFEKELDTPIDPYDISPNNEEAVLVGTEVWCATEFSARNWAKGCWAEMHSGKRETEEVVEGKFWPKGLKVSSMGLWMQDVVLQFNEPLQWKL